MDEHILPFFPFEDIHRELIMMGPTTVHYYRWYTWDEIKKTFGVDDISAKYITAGAERSWKQVTEVWGEYWVTTFKIEYMKVFRMYRTPLMDEQKREQ